MGGWRLWLTFAALVGFANAWYIAPPRQNIEWNEMVQLIVKTFDAPPHDASNMERIRWSLFEQSLTEAYTLRQYTQTARRMRGTKYSIFVVKQLGRVIGMVEVGINGSSQEKRPTIGLICVEKEFRQQGVAADLITQCEHLVTKVWKESVLYAEVEETNLAALQFFYSQGFQSSGNQTVIVNVRRRLGFDKRPHRLLSKELEILQVPGEVNSTRLAT